MESNGQWRVVTLCKVNINKNDFQNILVSVWVKHTGITSFRTNVKPYFWYITKFKQTNNLTSVI